MIHNITQSVIVGQKKEKSTVFFNPLRSTYNLGVFIFIKCLNRKEIDVGGY
jgi:hypothetical protein